MTNEKKDKLVHAILTDRRLAILGTKAREAKFAEMRTKTEKEVGAYIAEVTKILEPKVVSTLPRVDFIARLREVFKK
jgi:hypothetical protein